MADAMPEGVKGYTSRLYARPETAERFKAIAKRKGLKAYMLLDTVLNAYIAEQEAQTDLGKDPG